MPRIALFLFLAAALAAVCCRAQQQPPLPAAPVAEPAAQPVSPAPAKAPDQTDSRAQVHSFGTFVKRLFSVRALTSTLPAALVEQVHDWPDEWGRNGHGFEKRIASLYGQYAVGVGLEETVKAIDHEDTRYRRLGHGNFFRRSAHAVANTVTARREDGSRTAAWSLYAYAYGSWGIATLWSPHEYRTGRSIFEWGSAGMATLAVTNLAREYWPDIKAIFHHKKRD